MFDLKLYDDTGERETIRGLSWSQMATVQSVITRLHFLLGNNKYKHISKQVKDENEAAALTARVKELEEAKDRLEKAAFQAVAHVAAANYPEREREAYNMLYTALRGEA